MMKNFNYNVIRARKLVFPGPGQLDVIIYNRNALLHLFEAYTTRGLREPSFNLKQLRNVYPTSPPGSK